MDFWVILLQYTQYMLSFITNLLHEAQNPHVNKTNQIIPEPLSEDQVKPGKSSDIRKKEEKLYDKQTTKRL